MKTEKPTPAPAPKRSRALSATRVKSEPPAPGDAALSSGDRLPFMELPSVSRRHPAPAPSTADPATAPIGGEIRQTHLAFKNKLHRMLRERNVTSAQWGFLRILWNEDGLNQKELAQRVGVHPTTAVPAITILERNGYVTRRRGTDDKRNAFVHLTATGKQLAHELIPFATEVNERSLAGISASDVEKLMDLLGRIQRNLK